MANTAKRLFDAKDIAAACLYAKRVADDTADSFPLLANTDGSLTTTPNVGRTLTSSTGSLNATLGTLVTGTNKIKVYAFSLTTTSTTSAIATFKSGSLELWRVLLQAPSGANSGANLAVSPPAFLFSSYSGTSVTLNLSVAVPVEYSIAYFDEA